MGAGVGICSHDFLAVWRSVLDGLPTLPFNEAGLPESKAEEPGTGMGTEFRMAFGDDEMMIARVFACHD